MTHWTQTKARVRRAIGYNHGAADDGTEVFAADFVAYVPGQPPLDVPRSSVS
jgi:hypothetical protein